MRGPGQAGRQRCGLAWRLLVWFVLLLLLLGSSGVVDGKDLYKVLGVDKQASQADIKKAFHKQSLKYHPDKNPSKDAQVKFTEISNAYEILSDEEKRTNYDTYGDAEGPKGPGGGPFGWQGQGHQGGRQYFYQSSEPVFTFSYDGSVGGDGSNVFGSMYDSFFGGARGGSRGNYHFQEQGGSRSTLFDSMGGVDKLSGANIRQQVINKGKLAWLVLFYNPNNRDLQPVASVLKDVVDGLRGMIKVGVIDCASQQRLCDTEGALPLQDAKAFVYPYGGSDPVQYNGPWTAKSLKTFVTTHLPRKSTRLDTENFLQRFPDHHVLGRVILFTKKKETPAMWRALSGMYDNQVSFFDLQVEDEFDPLAKRFGVTDFPAVVGVFANGKETLLAGKADLEGTKTFHTLDGLMKKFRDVNKEAGPRQGDLETEVPFLSKSNMDFVCGEDSPICIFAVIKSLKHGGDLQKILTEVSRKSLVRQLDSNGGKKSTVSYGLVDASKHSSFLKAFGNPKSDVVIVAYKPRRKRYAVRKGVSTLEEVESFVSQALGGDLHFETCKNGPVLSV